MTHYYGKEYDVETVQLIKSLKHTNFSDYKKITKKHPTFKWKANGCGRGAYIGKNFVVKDPHIAGDKRPPKKIICPTTTLKSGIMIQPKCRVFYSLPPNQKDKYISSGVVFWCNFNDCHFLTNGASDAHDENFGLLNGELKQFDW